jgi:hypothetical protein
MAALAKDSTTKSYSRPAIKPIVCANVALHFAETSRRHQQYQSVARAKRRLLFKSGVK